MRRNTNQESGIDLSTEESIQPLTSEYAKLRFNKKGLVVGALVVVVALALMMGFMIASVVIGVNITKEVGIRNGALVPYRGNQVALKTSTMMYEQPLTLFSPLSVIESTKSITVNIKEGAFSGQFQFEVVSFVYVKGVQLVFYGHTHMASILGDGSVQLEPLVPFDGAKRDGSTTQTTGSATTISTAGGSSDVITLSTCSALTGATDASAQYALGADLNCALSGPLFNGQVFTGNFNGNGNTLTVQVSSSGSVGLFAAVQGTVQRLVLSGTFSGAGVCGGFTARALAGSLFSAVSFTGSVQCAADASGSVSVGGFAGVLESSSLSTSAVSFRGAISQGSQSSSAASGTANIGGFFGSAVSASASFSDSYVDSAISQTSANSAAKIDLVGNSATAGANCPSEVVAIVDNGAAPSETCLFSVERCPNLPDSNNCGPSICFGCRDTSLDRSLRPAVRPLTTPNFSPVTGNLRFF